MDRRGRILIVEDEALGALYMTLKLREMGHEVYPAVASGEEALACVDREKPDLILMDINLAGEMNGIEAARRIGESWKVPVIFTTGYSDEKIVAKAMDLDPAAFLVKPIDIAELARVISSALSDLPSA